MYVCEGHIQYAALIHGLDGAYSLEANKFTANSQQSARKTGAIDQERRTVGTVGLVVNVSRDHSAILVKLYGI